VKSFRPPYGDADDRVRAIATALGFSTVYWDVDVRGKEVSQEISKWFVEQPGFISLQNDNSAAGIKIAIDTLAAARSAPAQTNPLPIAQCLGIPFYRNGNVADPKNVTDGTSKGEIETDGSSKEESEIDGSSKEESESVGSTRNETGEDITTGNTTDTGQKESSGVVGKITASCLMIAGVFVILVL
jgi:hypothetical protein